MLLNNFVDVWLELKMIVNIMLLKYKILIITHLIIVDDEVSFMRIPHPRTLIMAVM